MKGRDLAADRAFVAIGCLTVLAVFVACIAAHMPKLDIWSGAFALIIVAILCATVLQLLEITPVNVIRPGLDGIAGIVAAARFRGILRTRIVLEEPQTEIIDLEPYLIHDSFSEHKGRRKGGKN